MQRFYVLSYKTRQLQRSFSGHFESLSSDWLTGNTNTHTDKCEHFHFLSFHKFVFPVTHDDASIHPFCSIGAFLQNCWSGLVPYILTSVTRIKKNEKIARTILDIIQKSRYLHSQTGNQNYDFFWLPLVTMLSESIFTF